jgi:hypothetical protein
VEEVDEETQTEGGVKSGGDAEAYALGLEETVFEGSDDGTEEDDDGVDGMVSRKNTIIIRGVIKSRAFV